MPDRPKLEDLIPRYLDGEKLVIALDFVAYMRVNKTPPTHRPSLRYKCNYKGKNICTINLPREWTNGNPYVDNEFAQEWMSQENITNNWIVIPQLDHLSEYANQIDETMKNTIWDPKNIYFCNGCWNSNPNFPGPRESCGPRPVRTVLGKEFQNICGRGFFWFFNPDEAAIGCIKKLLELEKIARNSAG